MKVDTQQREWLAAKEVAAQLGVHVTAVYRTVHEGRLPFVRLSKTGRSGSTAPPSNPEALAPWKGGDPGIRTRRRNHTSAARRPDHESRFVGRPPCIVGPLMVGGGA
jgi:excisionase family DNA binding protein